MFEAPPDQPQSVGDLIGRAFRVYRRHVAVFFRALLGPTIFSTIGALGLQWAITYGVTEEARPTTSWLILVAVVVVSVVALLGSKWVLALRQLAFVRMATGFAANYEEALAYMHGKKWHILALYVLGGGFMAVSTLFWVVFMVIPTFLPRTGLATIIAVMASMTISILGLVVTLSLSFLVGFLAFSIVACEDLSLGQAINRGFSLTMGDSWRALGFGGLMFITITALSYPLALPVLILSLLDICQQGVISESLVESYKMPLYLMVVSQIWESVINMLVWPVIFFGFGYLYYDMRLRQEGLDLDRRLDSLEGTAA